MDVSIIIKITTILYIMLFKTSYKTPIYNKKDNAMKDNKTVKSM